MAATNKSDLLNINQKEFEKLKLLIAPIPEGQAICKDDGTSIKDVIAHRAHWIDLFLGWYADGQAGKTVYFPAKGYKWNEVRRYNAELRQKQEGISWDIAISALDNGYKKLTAFIQSLSDAELYGGPMQGANNDWTPGRWAEAAGPSHFRSATKYIRSRFKTV
ncbi:ClbS/DfsB family four-helix bundle protein [Rhodobacteraceae bacterium B1Z28]|uniref:ClbS/DfsB family four-helix bundle protein n=1 Tax=Ruegeria haliotis TaxID=2747601 RepID=A0ABX2PJS8_9RHOB|nr:ClbS/DfsB family four-helix bundle protein [Ruegeria haliotis]NVO54368.1 ClbS/DfsB family four-helix bundle protein [Ruegeria haliotis]